MFKVSLPFKKIEPCNQWCDFFDLFCQSVNDEDILEKYASILEVNEHELQEAFRSIYEPTTGFIMTPVMAKVDEARFIFEGSKDHSRLTVSLNDQKRIIPYFYVDLDGLHSLTPSTQG